MRAVSRASSWINLTLHNWTCEIGPIQSFNLSSDKPLHVGWISVNLSGDGYLYPWSFADLVERIQAEPSMRRVAELCRQTWPVPVEQPDDRIRELRQQVDDLWPYPVDLPWDWYWGIAETG